MEEKNFLGLDGLKHFWTKIEAKVIKIIEDEIAQIIANAPEDLDTLKEIADWISTHEDSASAMNTAILANKTAISGKADKSHTHTKSQITDFPTSLKNPNALTINGKTYDGSSAVDAGVQTVANGGTGVTTQADINKAFIGNLDKGESDVTDGTEFVSSWASDNGFAETTEGAVNTPYKRQFIKVWNYIKSKISSVLGLTKDNYGGTAATILDYVKGTPIKVRWGGPGIDSAEWYPAFNADGSAIVPISKTNIHAGTATKATQLQTARTINIQDSSATYTGTGASFNGSGDATIKLPSTIKANEFKIGDEQQSIAYRSKSYNGFKMHEIQTNALYIEGRDSEAGDSGGLAITNDSVTVFGAGDTNGVFRVVNEDNAGDGSATAPSIFNIFKDGKVTMTNRLTAPSATIGSRPVITGTYSASDGILSLYTN